MSVSRTAKVSVSPCGILPVMATGALRNMLRALDVGPAWAQSDGPRDEKRAGQPGAQSYVAKPSALSKPAPSAPVMPHRCGVGTTGTWNWRRRHRSQRCTAQKSPRRRCSIAYIVFSDTTNKIIGPVSAVDETRGILVNTVCSSVVDDVAFEALKTGPLRHAALDVYTVEPLESGSPLRSMQIVILSAHAPGRRRMPQIV